MSINVWPSFTILKLPGGVTYRYIYVRPQARGLPHILFVHGFPSSSYDWRHQIQYFTEKGYGVVAPDLLGYGGTDKPQEVEAYRHKKMAGEIMAVLDHEGIQTVLGVGHDWYVLCGSASGAPITYRYQGAQSCSHGSQITTLRVSLATLSSMSHTVHLPSTTISTP